MCQDLMHIIGPFHWIPPRGGVKVDLEEQKRNTGGNLQNADDQIPGKLVGKRA